MTVAAEHVGLEAAGLSVPQLQDMLRQMIAARIYSNRCFSLQRQGRLGTMAPIDGAEGIVVGSAMALDPESDWVVPQYREFHGLLRFGEEILERFVRYLRGDPAGGHIPEPIHVWPPQISLAAQLPHAAGMAWGMRLRGREGVVLCYFGDGASSEGDFYEACNLAGVMRLPVIFLCTNNGWAISTPTRKQTAASSFADKAAAFGFPGELVDGSDPLAVYSATLRARTRALAGEGPTLIEAKAHRLGPHTTADDPSRYIPKAELEESRASDPIELFRQRLRSEGIWDEAMEEEATKDAEERMDRAVTAAESVSVEPDAFFDHLYSEPTPRMQRQRAELLAALEEEG